MMKKLVFLLALYSVMVSGCTNVSEVRTEKENSQINAILKSTLSTAFQTVGAFFEHMIYIHLPLKIAIKIFWNNPPIM